MRTVLFLGLAGFVAVSTGTFAQQRASFTGTWVATTDAPKIVEKSPNQVFGARFALSVEGNTVTLTRMSGLEDTMRGTFTADGTETRLRVPGRPCQGDSASLETLAWEGDALVHKRSTIIAPGGTPRAAAANGTIRFEGPDTLVYELHIAATADRPARTIGTVYKRSTEMMPDPPSIPAATNTPAKIADVAWIGTMWVGTTPTSTVEERWTPAASGGMLAIARTVRGDQLAAYEFLCIVERMGTLVYYAMPNGRTPATPFTLSNLTPDSATFENPANAFPKVIRYRRLPDGSLETTVSGPNNERAQVVVLKKI